MSMKPMASALLCCALMAPAIHAATLDASAKVLAGAEDTKLDAVMRAVADFAATPMIGATSAKAIRRHLPGLVKVNDLMEVQTYVYLQPGFAAYEALLTHEGVRVELVNEHLLTAQAWVPATDLRRIAQLPFVKRVGLPGYPKRRAGSVMTEGDRYVNGPQARNLGFTGQGVKVGVISDGIVGLAQSQSTGDLPSSVTVLNPGCDTFRRSARRTTMRIIFRAPKAPRCWRSSTTSRRMRSSASAARPRRSKWSTA